MHSVRVVTDSVAQIPPEIALEFSIEVVPAATVSSNGRVYADGEDLTPSLAASILQSEPEQFRTAAIAPSRFLDPFAKLGQTTNEILCVTLSSKLSAVNASATLAARQLEKEKPGLRISVFDSLNASGGEGLIALAAARAAARGRTFDEVVAAADRARRSVICLFVLDTIRYVYRTGRVPRIVGEAASKLGVRPICRIGRDGRVHLVGLARSRRAGVKRIMKTVRDQVGAGAIHATVVHARAEADALELKKDIQTQFKCETLFVSEFSPLMSYATGPGVLGVAACPAFP